MNEINLKMKKYKCPTCQIDHPADQVNLTYCETCKQVKPRWEFYTRKDKDGKVRTDPNGFRKICKQCQRDKKRSSHV